MNQTGQSVTIEPSAPEKTAANRRIVRLLPIMAAPLVLLLLAFGVFSGIRSRVEAGARLQQAAQAAAIPVVEVLHPKPATGHQDIALPGNVRAFNETGIYARTSGYVERWYADIGAHVEQGELLASIQTPELDHQLKQARAELKNAQANLEIAEITANRWQNLIKANAVSQQETDQAVSDYKSKRALVDSNTANVERLEQLQVFERITAPFGGVITARNIDIGTLVEADENSAPAELFHLAAISKMRVYIPVPEVFAPHVRSGEQVTLTLDAFPNEAFVGTVARNSNAIDLNSRTLNVEVDVNNPTGRLLPGAYATVHLKVPAKGSAVTIPSNALLFRSEGLRAGVVHDGQVALRPITIGQDFGAAVEVLSGLTPSDAVILNPSDSLSDGTTVRVRAEPAGTVRR